MSDAPDVPVLQAEMAERGMQDADQPGWYLYGIVRAGDVSDARSLLAESNRGDAPWNDSAPLDTIESAALAAIVRPVPLSEFDPDVLRARADDVAWLEAMVRNHNQVIAQLHDRMPILPARFGSVYARQSDVHAALAGAHDVLLRQLDHVGGCDEWAVHAYADHQAVGEKVSAEHPSAQQLRQEIAASRPGRAYLLQRRLADELATLTDQALSDMAQTAYDQLARYAEDARVSAPAGSNATGKREILHAAFLVSRAEVDAFLAEVSSLDERSEELACDCSGPWPPYSFAPLEEGQK